MKVPRSRTAIVPPIGPDKSQLSPSDSELAYSAEELRQLNLRRRSQERFAPYRGAGECGLAQ